MLQVEGVDRDALGAAGLYFVAGIEPVLSGTVLPAHVLDVAEVPGILSMDLPATSQLQLHESVPATLADHVRTQLGLYAKDVIIGVVDTGIDVFHQSFRNP